MRFFGGLRLDCHAKVWGLQDNIRLPSLGFSIYHATSKVRVAIVKLVKNFPSGKRRKDRKSEVANGGASGAQKRNENKKKPSSLLRPHFRRGSFMLLPCLSSRHGLLHIWSGLRIFLTRWAACTPLQTFLHDDPDQPNSCADPIPSHPLPSEKRAA